MEKIIHQIWVGPHQIPKREHEFVQDIILNEKGYEHKFWTNDNLPELPDNIQKAFDHFGARTDYTFQADVLKIFFIYTYGGIFMDVDFKRKVGFEGIELENYDGVFFHHDPMDFTLPNNIFGCKKGNKLFEYILNDITPNSNWYGPSWLGTIVKKYYNLPYIVDQEDLKNELIRDNILNFSYSELEQKHYLHTSLYSWSPENRKKFEKGGFNW